MRKFTFPDDVLAIPPEIIANVYEEITGRPRTDLSATLNALSLDAFILSRYYEDKETPYSLSMMTPFQVLGGLQSGWAFLERTKQIMLGKEIQLGYDKPWDTLIRPLYVAVGAGLFAYGTYQAFDGLSKNDQNQFRSGMAKLLAGVGFSFIAEDMYIMRAYDERISLDDERRMTGKTTHYWEE